MEYYVCPVCPADPWDRSLVYNVTDTGRSGEKRYRVYYKRGSNSNESINRPAKDLLLSRSNLTYAVVLLRLWFCYIYIQSMEFCLKASQ